MAGGMQRLSVTARLTRRETAAPRHTFPFVMQPRLFAVELRHVLAEMAQLSNCPTPAASDPSGNLQPCCGSQTVQQGCTESNTVTGGVWGIYDNVLSFQVSCYHLLPNTAQNDP